MKDRYVFIEPLTGAEEEELRRLENDFDDWEVGEGMFRKNFSDVNRTFGDRRKVGRWGEKFLMKYLGGREDTLGLRDVSNDPDYFSKGIDLLWYTSLEGDNLFFGRKGVDMVTSRELKKILRGEVSGREVGIEVKTTLATPYGRKQQFAFQLLSDVNSRRPGWLYTMQADRLVVFHLGGRILYSFNVPVLRDYLDELTEGENGVTVHDVPIRKGSRVLARHRCLFVPLELFKEEDYESLDFSVLKLE